MVQLATQRPVCVTGASGFVASHVVRDLLERGYRVRGTVRDATNEEKTAPLRALSGADDRLELLSADLLDPTSFEAAIADCEIVIHTASPYTLNVKDAQADLVEPAVQGTRAVLEVCHRAEGIRRVVVTSSVAAITDEPGSERPLTEEDWNELSSLKRNPYFYSKTLAEKAAWSFMEETSPSFELVVINPYVVIGPSLIPSLNQSHRVFVELMTGKLPGIVNLAWGFVDVRDVATAHRLAIEVPEARGRYLCAAETMKLRQLVELLQERGYGHYKLPKLGLESGFGNALIKLSSFAYGRGMGSFLRTHVGRVPRFDNSKIRRELGLSFRPVDQTIVDAVEDLLAWGHIERQAP